MYIVCPLDWRGLTTIQEESIALSQSYKGRHNDLPYFIISPFARTSLWHGTSGANEFLCSALPTARGLLQPTFIVILSICGKNSTIYLTDMGPAERCSLPDMHCISREKQSVKLLPELQACLLLWWGQLRSRCHSLCNLVILIANENEDFHPWSGDRSSPTIKWSNDVDMICRFFMMWLNTSTILHVICRD